MANILQEIASELAKDDGAIFDPIASTQPGETEVGVLNDELKRLYSLWKANEKMASQIKLDLRYSQVAEVKRIEILGRQIQKVVILEASFWVSVKDKFNLWGKEAVGVRRGWMVVWGKAEDGIRTTMRDIEKLFGEQI